MSEVAVEKQEEKQLDDIIGASYRLMHGDSLKRLKELADNSVDSVVCDPPYGLTSITKRFGKENSAPAQGGTDGSFKRLSKGFMGQTWDGSGIEYNVELWSEVLRVLKPGGHLIAFSGSRTYHRMAVAIEDAGFEIRDQILWIYGCYSEDTECLTNSGWKKYTDLSLSDKVLQWDCNTNTLIWKEPKRIFEYEYDGEMIQFNNRHTNQLLTPNHRVYVNYKKNQKKDFIDGYEVLEASAVGKSWSVNFPLASNLMDGVFVEHAYLIGWWLTDAWKHGDGKACMFSQCKIETLKKLRDYFIKNNFKFSEYVKKSKNVNHKDEHTFYLNDDISKYLIENFNERKLTMDVLSWDYDSRIRLLEGLMDGDGSIRTEKDYAHTFWSMDANRLDVFSALCLSLNYRSHVDYKKGCVYFNVRKNTTQLQIRHREEPLNYKGKIWCLETLTGAFVVRRNGRPFISGNSGFPKSLNIGKAIEKMGDGMRQEAEKWNGFGSALKPSHEPMVLARKPLSESTIAGNVLMHGTGGLNIDGCRVEYNGEVPNLGGRANHTRGDGYGFKAQEDEAVANTQGRFPANIVHDGSEEVLSVFPQTKGAKPHGGDGKPLDTQGQGWGFKRMPCTIEDSDGSAARYFYTAKTSKRDRNEGLEGFEKKAIGTEKGNGLNRVCNKCGALQLNPCDCEDNSWILPANQANNHPTVKPTDLMAYLCRLITPPNGTVLDPFNGSGSTGKACMREGFKYIGIDLSDEYLLISQARIEFEAKRVAEKKAKEIKDALKKNQEQSIKRFREKFPGGAKIVQMDALEPPSDGAIFEAMQQVPQEIKETFGIDAQKKD